MKVAKSYSSFSFDETKAYKNKNGKLVVDASCRCGRCRNGVFICRVENGQPIPHPNAGGVCFACGGSGFIKKTIRLYTDEEFEKMEKASQRAAEKKRIAAEEKMKAEFTQKKAEWLSKYSFNQDETTFIYFPLDSYTVKDELKNAGFRFNPNLLWHCAEIPEGYSDKVIEVSAEDVITFSAWGEGFFKAEAKAFVQSKLEEKRPSSKSEWIGSEKEKIGNLPVKLVKITPFCEAFGFSQVVKFLNGDNIITWFTATDIPYDEGSDLLLSGTIKKLDIYKSQKQTIMTRCKLREVE